MKDGPISFEPQLTLEEKIELLFKGYYVTLCQKVNRLVQDPTTTEDLVQEVFLKIWNKRTSIEFNDRIYYYLSRSCYHEALQHLKTQKPHFSLDGNHPLENNADQELNRKELEEKILITLNLLPEKTRLIFTLSRYEEMTYKEIATELNLSIKSVEKHMGNALKILRNHLKDYLPAIFWFFFQ